MEGFGDLYDRKNDPHELRNLWDVKQYEEVKNRLVDKLLHEVLKNQTRNPKRIAGT